MRRYICFLLVILSMALLCSCGGSNTIQEEPELSEPSPVPDVADSEPGVDQNEQEPTEEPDEEPIEEPTEEPTEEITEEPAIVVSITTGDVDIDGDGVADSVHAYSTDLFTLPFYVDITLSAEKIIYRMPIDTDCLAMGNKLRIVDVTGDGVPEIVFPDLGGTNTKGEISVVVLQRFGKVFKRIEVLQDGFFYRDSLNFIANEVVADFVKPELVYSITSYPSGKEYEIDLSDAARQLPEHREGYYSGLFFSYATFSGDVVELSDGKYGIRLKTGIQARAEKASNGGTDFLGRYYLYSTIEYVDGDWIVADEYLLPDES